jgi:hypothetical protein
VDLETGEPIPIGAAEAGELAIRGPQVMRGYWNRAEGTADCLSADGWLRTGDICTADDDGYFSIVDRKKDMIIASGYKILPRVSFPKGCNNKKASHRRHAGGSRKAAKPRSAGILCDFATLRETTWDG